MMASMDGIGEPWGRRLSHWRRDAMNWSQDELVQQVVRLAFEMNEERGTSLDVRLLGRWERGQVKRPQGVYRRLLAQLGAPPLDPPSDRSVADEFEPRAITSRIDDEAGDSFVLRRDFLRAGSAVAIPGLLAPLVQTGSGTSVSVPEVIAELDQRLAGLRKLDATLGGGDTYRLCAAEAEVTGHLLRDGGHRDIVLRRLLALYADPASRLGRVRRRVARRSPRPLPAQPRGRDRSRCLDRATDALGSANGQTPGYAAWIDEVELAIMAGRCWSELRRPLRAVPVLESALAGYSDAHSRDKALYSSWLADSYIDAGEIEQATTVVQSSLTVMGTVASVRPRERLNAVAGRLAWHRHLPVVRDLLSRHALHPFDVRR